VSAMGAALLALGAGHLWLLYVGVFLAGISNGIWTLLASATAAEFGSEGFGRALGIIACIAPLGSLAPPVVARLEELSGSFTSGFLGLSALSFGGACLAGLLRQRHSSLVDPDRAATAS